MPEKKWFWVRKVDEGLGWCQMGPMFDSLEEALAEKETYPGCAIVETAWGF